jgi:hypothetical protein
MRTPALRKWLSVLTISLAVGCTPDGQQVNDDPSLIDMSMPPPPPPPPCMEGRVRCNADKNGTERCVAGEWEPVAKCDTAAGDVCMEGACRTPCQQVTRGNVGCSFYPTNLWSTSKAGKFGVVVTNTSDKLTAKVKLLDAAGKPVPATSADGKPVTNGEQVIPPRSGTSSGVAIYRIEHEFNKLYETEQSRKGMHLESTAPVAVYQFHPIDAAEVFSGSATLLLPEHVMAKSYFVMSYTYNQELITSPPQGQGFVAVIAIEDDTVVEVKVPVATKGGNGIPSLKAGDTLRRVLKRLEVLEIIQVNSREDISGATVKSSKPVVVFGGAGGVSIPSSAVGGNHLGVQMFPLETWGKKYLAAKVKQRNASDKDTYRIVASVDNTTVKLMGPSLPASVPPLSKGEIFEFSTASNFLIEADQPIMAFQYMPAWGNLTGTYDKQEFPRLPPSCPYIGSSDDVKCLGDANITPLIPVEQYRDDYIFYVPRTYTYDFINVYAPLDTMLTLDGNPVTAAITKISDTPPFGRVIIPVTAGTSHRISGTKPFGLIGYGYAYATSYSYAGGLNLDRINPIE